MYNHLCKICLTAIIAAAGSVCLDNSVRAEWLTNGNFEATPFDSGWTNDAASSHRGLTATGLDGTDTQAAIVRADYSSSATLWQSVSADSSWQLDLLFAAGQTGTGKRSMFMAIPTNQSGAVEETIYMYLGDDAKFHAYDAANSLWQTVSDTTVSWSVDADANHSFADDGDTLNVHSLRIVGDYSTASPTWDMYLSAANSASLTLLTSDRGWFNVGTPDEGDSPVRVMIYGGSNYFDKDYVVDQISLVPEPGTLTLLIVCGLCLLGLGYRRWNRRVV